MHSALKLKLSFLLVSLAISFPPVLCAAEAVKPGKDFRILSLIEKGGFMMYPILFCSVLTIGIGLERAYNLRRKNIIDAVFLERIRSHWNWKDIQLGLQLCTSHNTSLSRIL